MASRYLGQTLMQLGQQIPLSVRSNRQAALGEEELLRRNRMEDERMGWDRQDAERKRIEQEREAEAQRAVDEALRLIQTPQQEPVLPEMQSSPPPLGESLRTKTGALGTGSGLMPPKLSVGGDTSRLTDQYLPKPEMRPYKAPMSPKSAMSQSGVMGYLDKPEAKNLMDTFKETEDKNPYGRSNAAAHYQFTQEHPELVQQGKDIVESLRAKGVSGYDEELLKTAEGLLSTNVMGGLDELFRLQSKTGSAVRTLEETTPGQIYLAGGKAAASGEAGTRARIQTEYETQKGIPGSFKQNQYTAGNYANRIQQSESVLSNLNKVGFDPGSFYNKVKSADALNAIKDPEQRKYAQAMRNFINATLRRESGAAIAESEFTNANKNYFAQLNDDPDIQAQKAETRARVFDAFKAEAGGAYDQIVDEGKSRTTEPGSGLTEEKRRRLAELRAKKAAGTLGR